VRVTVASPPWRSRYAERYAFAGSGAADFGIRHAFVANGRTGFPCYVYPSFKGPDARFAVGFDLYRRSVRPDGRLGPEQRLTDRTAFNPFAPSAHRLRDGTVLVSFSDILENGADGVSRAQLTVFRLKDDAAPVAP